MARWIKGKEGGKAFNGVEIIQLALRLNRLPSEIENEDVFWINRLKFYLHAESEAEKMK